MAAILGAFAYGLSGFFAGHASHVSLFAGAAMFPWLLLAYRRAVDVAAVRYTALGGLVGAALILAGSGAAAVWSFLGLGLYAFADWWRERQRWLRTVAIAVFMLAGALACAAIQLLPALELAAHSTRAAGSSTIIEGVLHPGSLMTLVAPDWLGAISGGFNTSDMAQYYFYAGLLVLPLAAIGVVKSGMRLPGLLLIVPPVWYMLGPAGGLYYLESLAPSLHKLRAPVEGWFLVALGLALLAAAGGDWIFARWRIPYLPLVVAGLLFVDVWYWNSLKNPLAYAHASFDELYGSSEEAGRLRVALNQPPLTRFDAPGDRASMGPTLHPLDLSFEVTYGPFLNPGPYQDYLDAMRAQSQAARRFECQPLSERRHRQYRRESCGAAARLLSESRGRREKPGGVPPGIGNARPRAQVRSAVAAPAHPAGSGCRGSGGFLWRAVVPHPLSRRFAEPPETQRRLVPGVARQRGGQAAADRARGSRVDGCDSARGR